ncbi:hypothetical protein CERZMDRAFT_103531 [Cercospora zeae-maydis SCOH1-5]|uniref:Uncharacterized protein n=1 Tax=Cercospora zeae-maydis SCOH1-5 TaxID=717836 RepID=A0A6A6EZ49_9PEZI|nr:hypothetical protein CERZMDRAFT_103531 [Cercospora zeae-maydis SCOH1-5]
MRSIFDLPFAIAILLLQTTALAFPASSLEDTAARLSIEKRNINDILAPTLVGLYVCTDIDWKGTCQDLQNGPGLCINLGEPFAANISSVGPDSEVSGCTLFVKENCDLSGEFVANVKKPGLSDLSSSPQGGRYNDKFMSYICY